MVLLILLGLLGLTASEGEIQAAFLFHFTKFVDWPAPAPPPAPGTPPPPPEFRLCVLGTDPYGPALDKALAGKTVRDQPVTVLRLAAGGPVAEGCRIVYVGDSEAARVPELVGALAGRDVLTVSNLPDFTQRGGTIGFVRRGDKVRFELNLGAAERARLTVSPQLVKVADRVLR